MDLHKPDFIVAPDFSEEEREATIKKLELKIKEDMDKDKTIETLRAEVETTTELFAASQRLAAEMSQAASLEKERAEKVEAKNQKMRDALEMYAAPEEWGFYKGSPWKLMFNSSTVDGHGWSIAQQALKETTE